MSHAQAITIPAAPEIAKRIDACRREIAALKKLHKAAKAAQEAESARNEREAAQ
jgi:hypothetical protein